MRDQRRGSLWGRRRSLGKVLREKTNRPLLSTEWYQWISQVKVRYSGQGWKNSTNPTGWKLYIHRKTCTQVSRATLSINGPKVDTTQMPITWWMHKQSGVSPYSGILFGHKEERNTDTRYSTDQPWRHDANERSQTRKGQILYDSMYRKCLEQENL